MAAAALAAGIGLAWVGEPHSLLSVGATMSLAVLGGVVEGLAVGIVQFHLLSPWLPQLAARRWVGVTVAAAAAGWFLGMLYPTLSSWLSSDAATSSSTTGGPPLWLMPLAGLALGAVMGVGFGAAQMWALRGCVAHPGRWVPANALGWAAALAVIMTGAAVPSGPWPLVELLALGMATGILAGLAVGAVTALFLPSLDDPTPLPTSRVNHLVSWLLRSPAHRVLSGAVVELRLIGRRTRSIRPVPVQYAQSGDRLVVWPAHAPEKLWWRNLSEPAPVDVVLRGEVRSGIGRVVPAGGLDHPTAAAAYCQRFHRADVAAGDVLVVVDLVHDQPDRSAPRNRSNA